MKILTGFLLATAIAHAAPARFAITETLEIAKVPADFRVGFSLLTTPDRQYAAYYDAQRQMTVASRTLDSTEWTYQSLPSKVGWDSHNYVTMAIDPAGHLHVSGNMHVDPLVYFRTETAGDITSLKPEKMTGELENRITYPRFFTDHKDRLIFTYRHGGSGDGINIYNRYDPTTRTWSRLMDTPLFDGENKRNAYPNGPTLGPDGWFHVHWVWRHTPDCATNHHLSYARSRDLIEWESAFGKKIELPIRIDHRELLVDPIPAGGGIINGGHRMILDANHTPVFAYHKNDEAGNMQVFAARPEYGAWKHQALTDWKHPVPFSGGGSMGFIGISLGSLDQITPDTLSISYRHKDEGRGILQFEADTLARIGTPIPVTPEFPPELRRTDSKFPGIAVRRASDAGTCGTPGIQYLLQWESLGANRDQPPEPPSPAPSTLRLHKLIEISPEP